MKKAYLSLGLTIAVMAFAAVANANSITPGTSAAPDTFASVGGTVLASVSGNFTGTNTHGTAFTGSYTEDVVKDSTNALCPSCLDFVISFKDISGTSIDTMSTSDFSALLSPLLAPASVDVGVTGSGTAASNVSWSLDGITLNFSFGSGVTAGSTAATLQIETNAKFFSSGDISFIDSGTANVAGFMPIVPEPAIPGLIALGLLLLGCADALLRKRALSVG